MGWTFGKKIAAGFAAVVLVGVAIAAVCILSIRRVSQDWERVAAVDADSALDARTIQVMSLRRVGANRAFLLTRDESFLTQVSEERRSSDAVIAELEGQISTPEEKRLLAVIGDASKAQAIAADAIMALRRKSDVTIEEVSRQFQQEVVPKNKAFQDAIDDFVRLEEKKLEDAKNGVEGEANAATWLTVGIAVCGCILAAVLAWMIGRSLSRQIGSAVQHIGSSSSELQAAANQQTAGTKEQVASMNEISTTIKELLATARQIADSAQRVAGMAAESAAAAQSGDTTVQKAQADVAGIRAQVDQIVGHMLDLGRKSQQIGAILEIINELAEQTNILAINATIEAAGAGEAGRRFGVVAEEIRKLADRVGGSTKEIRALIEEIRGAVHTTVMATESGSKAVDVVVRQFGDVTGAFRRIAGLLGTTTEAAREIELSTKQQSTAVEQVTIAIANVTQSARESEASSGQVLQTVVELSHLSRDLGRIVRAGTGGNGKG